MPYPPLHSAIEGIDRFLTKNTRIGIRRTREGYEVYAPDGFDDAENLVARPNMTANFSAENYVKKTARWKALWPEVTVLPVGDELNNIVVPAKAGTHNHSDVVERR